jgi:hypothetical protein
MADVTPEQIWYTKSREWTYEREWRVTRWINRAVKTVKNPAGEDLPLHRFPREAVREVILGQRADDLLEFEILELVTTLPYDNVTVLRAELDQTTFKLNIVPR